MPIGIWFLVEEDHASAKALMQAQGIRYMRQQKLERSKFSHDVISSCASNDSIESLESTERDASILAMVHVMC
jgi:hypothetical protein